MKFKKLHIIGIISVTMLFSIFTLMHQYDWLIPPSPVAPLTPASSVPVPDAVEEYGGEDDITHNFSKSFYISKSKKIKIRDMILEDLFIPQVSTPPPDYIV